MAKALARLIRTKRDYHAAIAAVMRLRDESARESVQEQRLQALLKEIEKFDTSGMAEDDDTDADDAAGEAPRRRWSDDD